jgi:pyridinium-3,5-bisthiocarboxylic acid mononucleotide nickel chelatase
MCFSPRRALSADSHDSSACLIPPTGAAIVREFAESFGPMLRMKIERIGCGVGTRELKEGPNVPRAVLGEAMGCRA